jgi:hypothetical protein
MVTFKSHPHKRVSGGIVFDANGRYKTDDYDKIKRLQGALNITSEGLDEFMARPLAVIYDDKTFSGFLVDALIKHRYRVVRRPISAWSGKTEHGAAIVFAKGRKREEIRLAYGETPFFVFDWGYIARVNSPSEHYAGHWQVARDRLNNIPSIKCRPDRFKALNIPIAAKGGDPDGYVLLVGQMPNDSALNGVNHSDWLKDQTAQYENVVYRPHPRGGIKSLDGVPTDGSSSFAEALKGARLVVTYNSNAGHEALLGGVPVICDPCAAYAELSGEKIPSVPVRRAFYNRVAYGQWTVYECNQMLDFILGGGFGDL